MFKIIVRSNLWIMVLPSLFVSACGFSRFQMWTRETEIAQQAADKFHQCLTAGAADTIYDQATNNYHLVVSREVNRGLFTRLRRKLGTCTKFKPTGTFVNSSNRGTYVTTSYRTDCERGGLDESFIWSIENGRAKLWKYSVASPLLLTD